MVDGASTVDRVRPMADADAAIVFAWRNHPEVRRHMFTRHEIAWDEHRKWFEGGAHDPRSHRLIYEQRGLPLGFVSLTLGRHSSVADWGFYTAPDAPQGTGRAMGRRALDHAFGVLGLHKVCGQVIEHNQRSMDLHAALGFRQEGILRDQYFDGKQYHAVVCFGLLRRDWHLGAGE
jgi:UDP-4-amino-4,6-dideoxy-N-acetyl-beta-L-altrosamine N-acetyltransferase